MHRKTPLSRDSVVPSPQNSADRKSFAKPESDHFSFLDLLRLQLEMEGGLCLGPQSN